MKKILLSFLVAIMALSLVLAAGGSVGTGTQGSGVSDTATGVAQTGQGTGNGSSTNTETQNKGSETQLQNQVKVQSGTFMNQEGKQMQIQAGEGKEVKLQSGNIEARTTMNMTQEQDRTQNRTKLNAQLSNGKNAEIKVMPDTASQRAIERLQLKNCNSENNCSIELKEVGNGEQVKAVYEVQAQKESRVLGLFKKKMNVEAQIDAETGKVIKSDKPWWAFIASE